MNGVWMSEWMGHIECEIIDHLKPKKKIGRLKKKYTYIL